MKNRFTKVYIEFSSFEYEEMFKRYGFNIVYHPNEADLICFTGGSDVSPNLYGEQKHPRTGNSLKRDEAEYNLFFKCKELNIPMVGICRGGQFLNVMNEGKMFQDVNYHCRNHNMIDIITNEQIFVSSTHHQMMRPGKDCTVVCIANEATRKEYMEKDVVTIYNGEDKKDYEVLFYPATKSLCFQPHPEFKEEHYKNMTDYFFSLLNRYFNI